MLLEYKASGPLEFICDLTRVLMIKLLILINVIIILVFLVFVNSYATNKKRVYIKQ